MSLINNMLKDLEKRKSPHHMVPLTILINEKPSYGYFLFKHIYKLSGIIFGIVAAAILITATVKYMHQPKQKLSIPTHLPAVQSKALEPSSTIDTSLLSPVLITGVTLQVKDNITELTFLLNHAALYRLNTDDMNNKLNLVLEHAELQSTLPLTTYLNTAIQQLTTKKVRGDTQFDITLYPGAAIKYVNLNTDEKNPELVVAIEYQTSANHVKNGFVSIPIKTQAMNSLLLEQYQVALKAAESGNYSYAINSLAELLKTDPNHKDARVSLTALLLDQGQPTRANKIIEEGLTANPTYTPFIELKARILTTQGRVKAAIALLQNTAPQLSDNPDYHAFIAALYTRSNHDQLAIKIYQQLLDLNPHNGNWWFGLGVSLDKLNQRQGAVEAFNKAITEGHLNADSLAYLQKRLHVLQGDTDA